MEKIIEIKKDMKLVSEGTDNILIGLSEEDKKFALIRTSELYLKNDVSGKQIDDMIFKQQKETEEMIKNMQKY